VFVPGTFTLSGTVTALTDTGERPVEAVSVYRVVASGWRAATTDKRGMYVGTNTVTAIRKATKNSPEDTWQSRAIPDIQLVQR
jgi:hypothetical protein